jgi:hypothetical protein
VTAGAARLATGVEFDLPAGWWCLDLTQLAAAQRLGELLRLLRGSDRRPPDANRHTLAYVSWLRDQGASIALVRPGDECAGPAICGGVFVERPLPVSGADLYAQLDACGEAVALGDLGGIPVVSHIGRGRADDVTALDMVQITYLLCAAGACVVLSFYAAEGAGVERVVGEVARVVSAAQLVHSAAGCPV